MLSFLTVTAAQAQDASLDDILKNYFENIGGEDEWKKIKSMTMKGKNFRSRNDYAGYHSIHVSRVL